MRRKAAFTLVELLVVIGIIAVLIAILLPVLNKAREAAQRTACLSNMRELSTYLRMYSTTNRDFIPIGFMDQKAFSYIMYWNNGGGIPRASQMGLIVEARLLKGTPKIFYCPTETYDLQFTYQPNPSATTPSLNPWPFWSGAIGGSNRHTRLGYSARPIVDWPSTHVPGLATIDYTKSTAWLPSDGIQLTLAKLSRVTNLAILADTNYCMQRIKQRHKKGINVLYGHGGAQWVDLKTFAVGPTGAATAWAGMDENTAFNDANNNVYLNDGTWSNASTRGTMKPPSQHTGLWVDLDKAK